MPAATGCLEFLERTLAFPVIVRGFMQAREHGFLGDYVEDHRLRGEEGKLAAKTTRLSSFM